MSLDKFQRDQARFHGGRDIKARKAHLSRTTTAIRKLRTDAIYQGGELEGVFTAEELQTISQAAQLVDRAVARLEADAREADRIKRDFDALHTASIEAMREISRTSIADCVALCAADSSIGVPFDGFQLKTLRKSNNTRGDLDIIVGYAYRSIALRCALAGSNPSEFKRHVEARLPQLKEQHAVLISELNALAVSQQLERVT